MRSKILAMMAAVSLLFTILAVPVKADEGLAIGVIGNMAEFSTTGHETEGSGANAGNPEQTFATIGNDADYTSVFVEYTARDGMGGIALGVEYVPGSASIGAKSRTDTNDENSGSNNGTYTAKAEVEDLFTIYAEPTFYPTENLGIYVKGGVSQVTVNSLESISLGTDSSVYGNATIRGLVAGAGVRVITPFGIFLKLEYLKTDYQSLTLKSNVGNQNTINADVGQESTRLAVGYQF